MRFHTFGSDTNQAIVLIHGMLNPWPLWQQAIDAFSDEYYVIVPELDAHTEDASSRFETIEKEAEQIRQYLLAHCGGKVYAICGLSMGGRIAATLASLPGITTENLVLDGAPLCSVPKLLVGFMKKSYISIIRKSKQRDPKVLESAKKDFLPETLIPDFLKVADHMEEQSIHNMLDSVFSSFAFRKYDCRILFMHGTKGNESVSKKAAIKLKAVNPQTEIRCFDGYSHAQVASFETEKWIEEVKSFLLPERNAQERTNGYAYFEMEDMTSSTFVFPKRCREVYDGQLIVCRKNTQISRMPEVVTIPDGVTVLDEEAFMKDNDIVKVICPDSLQVIGNFAFALCKKLEEVVLPESLCGTLSETFTESPALRRVDIPRGITKIGSDAFSFCTGLEAVTIPDTVKRIGDRAFYKCENLKELYIPDSVEEINAVASITSCKSLERVRLPEHVRFLHDDDCGYTLFMNCESLKELIVGDRSFAFYPEELVPMEVDRELTDEEIRAILAIFCKGEKPYAVADEAVSRVRTYLEQVILQNYEV